MEIPGSFDLPQFMFAHFPRVGFGGDLFGQWPVGIRFEIGLEQVSRAMELHEFIFNRAGHCILVSQDWPSGKELAERFTSLFSTPGVFPHAPSQFQTVEVSPFDESPYRLTWTRVPLDSFDAAQMFQGIANCDHGRIPSIAGGVYTIDDRAEVIMHMYDDRGFYPPAANAATLLPIYERVGDWILENQRHRIEFRFKNFLAESSSTEGETDF